MEDTPDPCEDWCQVRCCQICLDELYSVRERSEAVALPCGQVIDDAYRPMVIEQSPHKMRADEARSPRDQIHAECIHGVRRPSGSGMLRAR